MTSQPSTSSAVALRSALGCQFAGIRRAAVVEVRRALRASETLDEAAEMLGLSARSLRRLRAEYPELDR